jgi:hypothetical protein
MESDSRLVYEPATSEYVMQVMRSLFGPTRYLEKTAPRGWLELTTTIDDWEFGWGLGDQDLWQPHYMEFLSEWWSIGILPAEWRPLVKQSHERTVGDVCDLIARYALRPVIPPTTYFGSECGTADAFLAIRSFLALQGADVSAVSPSTPVAPYTRQFWKVMDRWLRRLAPDGIPRPEVVESWRERAIRMSIWIGVALLPMSVIPMWVCREMNSVSGFMIALGLIMSIGVGTVAVLLPEPWPDRVTYPSLRTFRDLAEQIAESDG